MNARSRRAAGCFVLLAYLALYTIIAATIGGTLADAWPMWAVLAYYAVAGVVWVLPLKPLIDWMRRP